MGKYAFRVNEEDFPKNYKEAIESDEGKKWREAIDEEIQTLEKMGIWRLEDLPADQKPIGCKWVYI